MLASIDQTSVTGARDHAVLLLLTRLGLRASDVAALTVDAIDWRNGRLRRWLRFPADDDRTIDSLPRRVEDTPLNHLP